MNDPTYTLRLSLAREETTYRLSGDAVHATTSRGTLSLPLADIGRVRVYEAPAMTTLAGPIAPVFARCVIRPKRGRAIVLSSRHFAGIGRYEDRSATFRPFVDALVARLRSANPAAELVAGMPPALWWTWLALLVMVALATPVFLVVIAQELVAGRALQVPAIVSSVVVLSAAVGIASYARVLKRNRPRRLTPAPS